MKRIIVAFLLILNIGIAYGASDKTITSKTYVDNQLATKQDKIRAIDDKTVITHTGSAGEIGEKGIYDSANNYAEQQTSLVTAGDANTGINNALENEFVCVDEDTDGTCLLWKVKNTSPQRILPTGYTALEYLEGTGTQWIDTGVVPTFNTGVLINASLTSQRINVGSTSGNDNIIFGATDGSVFAGGAPFSIDIFPGSNLITFPHGGGVNGSYIPNRMTNIPNIVNQVYTFSLNHLNDGLAKVDSNQIRLEKPTTTMTSRSLYLFNCHNNYTDSGSAGPFGALGVRIYNASLTEGSNVLHSYVPARRDSDGKLGMYDLVSNQFLTNRGSGTFTAGPDLDVYIPSGN